MLVFPVLFLSAVFFSLQYSKPTVLLSDTSPSLPPFDVLLRFASLPLIKPWIPAHLIFFPVCWSHCVFSRCPPLCRIQNLSYSLSFLPHIFRHVSFRCVHLIPACYIFLLLQVSCAKAALLSSTGRPPFFTESNVSFHHLSPAIL